MEFAEGKILATVEGGVGRITFNQPEKRNAMSIAMWDGLTAALDLFETHPEVRVLVLEGAGDKAFVSGADISQFDKNRSDAEAQKEYDRLTSGGRAKLGRFPKPVIGKIRGFCLGGGLGIAMQCDIRIVASDAQLGIPAAKLGLAYGFDMVRTLVGLVGPIHAKRILFTGDRVDAATAERIGLVNQVVPVEALEDTVATLAADIAGNAPLTIRAAKLAVAAALQDKADRDMAGLSAAIAACFDSEDYREGRRAFLEKRKPAFRGR